METPAEISHSKLTIVIHPGSLNLRIGRAADLNPINVLHVVARRRPPAGRVYSDCFLPPRVDPLPNAAEIEEARLGVSHTLQSCLQSDGRRRYATPPQQIAAFNRRCTPETITHAPAPGDEPLDAAAAGDYVVGNDVLRLDAAAPYNVHFPFRRGELNVHADVGGSLRAVIADLRTIWTHVLETRLGVARDDLPFYKAVLVVPDVYNRTHLRELADLLLAQIGFGGAFIVQDHVAATFGSGLSYACVVDVGDQKTSVSCVEDGICHPNTRVRLEYGGADIAQTFFWLLQKCAFPHRACGERSSRLDAMLLRQLKEECCHVNLDICGSQEKTFIVPGTSQRYTIQVGDECIVAPLSLFTPELLAVTGPKAVHTQKRNTGDPSDPHDENYLREVRRKGFKDNLDASAAESDALLLDTSATAATSSTASSAPADDDIVVDAIDAAAPPVDKDFVVQPGQMLGLDQAVLQSIDRCPSEDLKRKMYGCVLVVGGGMKFAGIGTWLQNRISLQVPYLYRAEQLDIITNPRDMDPAMVAWKGAAIMSCLETAQELWITPADWQRYGVRVLRERAPFSW